MAHGVRSTSRFWLTCDHRAADGVVYTSHLPTCPFDEDIRLYEMFEDPGVSDDGSRLTGLRPLDGDTARSSLCSSAKPRRATKEGQWVLRRPLHIRTLSFATYWNTLPLLLLHIRTHYHLVLRPLSPHAIASLGVAQQ